MEIRQNRISDAISLAGIGTFYKAIGVESPYDEDMKRALGIYQQLDDSNRRPIDTIIPMDHSFPVYLRPRAGVDRCVGDAIMFHLTQFKSAAPKIGAWTIGHLCGFEPCEEERFIFTLWGAGQDETDMAGKFHLRVRLSDTAVSVDVSGNNHFAGQVALTMLDCLKLLQMLPRSENLFKRRYHVLEPMIDAAMGLL
jgi:hypothetical protein